MSTQGLRTVDAEFAATESTVLPVRLHGREVSFVARAYRGADLRAQALALVSGAGPAVPLVRIQSGCVTGDVFHSLRCDCHAQLEAALARIAAADHGILIYLPYQEGRGIGLFDKIRAYALQDQGMDTVDANLSLGAPADGRDYALAARILADLGQRTVRLMTNNPTKVEGLRSNGIAVEERVELSVAPNPHNRSYLATKKDRMAHLF